MEEFYEDGKLKSKPDQFGNTMCFKYFNDGNIKSIISYHDGKKMGCVNFIITEKYLVYLI